MMTTPSHPSRPHSVAATPVRTAPGTSATNAGTQLRAVETDEHFTRQPTSSAKLPDPAPLIENLARSVIEVLAGAREIEQIARWLSEGVYQHLLKRVVLSARARAARRAPAARPVYTLGSTRITSPADGVIEATVILHGRARTRAIAIRLEGLDSRWRATALHVL